MEWYAGIGRFPPAGWMPSLNVEISEVWQTSEILGWGASIAAALLLGFLYHVTQLHAEGPGHVGAFVGAEAALVCQAFGEGGVILLHGAEVGGEEVGDEFEVEGEVLGDSGGDDGDEREVNGEELGIEREVRRGFGLVAVAEEARLDASADAEADGGVLVPAEVFAEFVAEGNGECFLPVAGKQADFGAVGVGALIEVPLFGAGDGQPCERYFMEDIAEVSELHAAAHAEELAGHVAGEGVGEQDGIAFHDDEGACVLGDEIEEEVVVGDVEFLGEGVGLQR